MFLIVVSIVKRKRRDKVRNVVITYILVRVDGIASTLNKNNGLVFTSENMICKIIQSEPNHTIQSTAAS